LHFLLPPLFSGSFLLSVDGHRLYSGKIDGIRLPAQGGDMALQIAPEARDWPVLGRLE
jgi:hypothetical protein